MKNHETKALPFEYNKPAPLNVRLVLLEADGKIDVGAWKGPQVGSNPRYIGWAPVPARDHDLERKLAGLR
jgi:hypothetical protein